ncbi:MAG: VOC family protein, partial [Candidatus Rokubacteria bacterium]|nr:VOC family protein [Candidatus Rokubacteria bacterium]
MLKGIDHIVIAVRDLGAAVAGYRALGFTVVPGGRHPAATENALIAFADGAYVELLAFWEPGADHRWWQPLQRGGGLVDFCLQTDDLGGDMAAFRRAGVALEDRGQGARARPDGYQVRWILSVPPRSERGVAPFLIEDQTPRAERVPQETTHANGVTGIGTVTVAVADVAPARGWYGRGLGRAGQDIRRDDLEADGARFLIGPHALELLAPRGGRGPIATWLGERGSSPYAATLTSRGGTRGALDPTLA